MRICDVKTVIGIPHQFFNHFTDDGQVKGCYTFLVLKISKQNHNCSWNPDDVATAVLAACMLLGNKQMSRLSDYSRHFMIS